MNRHGKVSFVWLAVLSLLILGTTVLTGCVTEPAKPAITEATLAKALDDGYRAVTPATTFTSDTQMIYCSVKVEHGSNTPVKAVWVYLDMDPDYQIDSYTENVTGSSYVGFSISIPNNGWPVGAYELRLYLGGSLTTTRTFTIVAE